MDPLMGLKKMVPFQDRFRETEQKRPHKEQPKNGCHFLLTNKTHHLQRFHRHHHQQAKAVFQE